MQLVQDGTSTRAVAGRFAVSVSVMPRVGRCYQETSGDVEEGDNPAAAALALLLWKEGQVEHCQDPAKWPPQGTQVHLSAQVVRNRLHEGGVRARRPQLVSGDAVETVPLPTASSSMTSSTSWGCSASAVGRSPELRPTSPHLGHLVSLHPPTPDCPGVGG